MSNNRIGELDLAHLNGLETLILDGAPLDEMDKSALDLAALGGHEECVQVRDLGLWVAIAALSHSLKPVFTEPKGSVPVYELRCLFWKLST